MDKITMIFSGRLQVFFEQPFWVGIFEHDCNGKLSVCKVTFGKEPKDYDVLDFIQKNYYNLKFSPTVSSEKVYKDYVNPKRMQRDVKKQIANTGIGTKSQQALKLMQEQVKIERKTRSCNQREAEKQFQFKLKKQKRKEKHKGR